MVECNAQGADADSSHFLEIHRRLCQNAGVHPLVEIHTALYRFAIPHQCGARGESQLPDFSNDLPVAAGRGNIVVHQDQVFLFAVPVCNALHQTRQRRHFPLCAFQFGHAAKMAFAYAASGRITKIGVVYGVGVVNVFKDTVIRRLFFNGDAGYVLCTEIPIGGGQRQSLRWWAIQQARYEPNARPAWLVDELL